MVRGTEEQLGKYILKVYLTRGQKAVEEAWLPETDLMRSQAQARTWHGDWALNAELTSLRSCVPQHADSECWGVLCQPKPGLLVTLHFYNPVAVAEWTKCMGMVTPVIGSSLHLGSWQYDVINRLYDYYSSQEAKRP